MRPLLAAMLIVAASACSTSTTSRTPTAGLPCAAIVFPPNPRIAAWSVDRFAGHYTNGKQSLIVRRDDQRLLVERPGQPSLMLQPLGGIESWKWADGCGATYAFILPPDGPGARLTVTEPDGTTSEWQPG